MLAIIATSLLATKLAPSIVKGVGYLNPTVPEDTLLTGSMMGSWFFNFFLNVVPMTLFIFVIAAGNAVVEEVNLRRAEPQSRTKSRKKAQKKRNKAFMRLVYGLGIACIAMAPLSAAHRFYVTRQDITFRPFEAWNSVTEQWSNVGSVELDCSEIVRGRHSPSAHVPDYIVHFRDGQKVDLWFGGIMGGITGNDAEMLYDFPAHYKQIAQLVPAQAPIMLGPDIAKCVRHMHQLNDAVIESAIASVLRSSNCYPDSSCLK